MHGSFRAARCRPLRQAGMPDATTLRLRRGWGRRWLPLHLNLQVAELFGLNGARRVGCQARAFCGFRECDYVADARRVAEDRDEAIKAERDAAVRRRAVFERFEH